MAAVLGRRHRAKTHRAEFPELLCCSDEVALANRAVFGSVELLDHDENLRVLVGVPEVDCEVVAVAAEGAAHSTGGRTDAARRAVGQRTERAHNAGACACLVVPFRVTRGRHAVTHGGAEQGTVCPNSYVGK
jgi:hypothetical protein